MKHKGSILICGAALAILLGMSTTQTAQADDVDNSTVSTSQVTQMATATSDSDNTNNGNAQTTVSNSQTQVSKSQDESADTSQYPGGDWSVDPSTATAKQNFYYYVNGKWQAQAQIPADKSQIGVSSDMQNTVDKEMIGDLNDFVNGDKQTGSQQLQQAVDYYQKAYDTQLIKTSGLDSVKADVQQIQDIKNYDDFNQQLASFEKQGFDVPFDVEPEVSLTDSNKNILYFNAPGTILPDSSYYDNDDDGTIMLSRYAEGASKLLKLIGYSDDEITNTVEQALAFDRKINQYTTVADTSLDKADDFYHPMDMSQFIKSFKYLKVGDYAQQAFPTNTDVIDIGDSRYLKNFNTIVNNNTLDQVKSWMIVSLLTDNASLLGQEANEAMAPFNEKYKGIDQMPSIERQAYDLTKAEFEQILSEYYGKTYFGETAKKDATRLIDNILDVYRDRLQNNTWLSDATKQNAIEKLNKITLKVAYPEIVPDDYSHVKISSDKSLYDLTKELNEASYEAVLNDFDKKVDRNVWSMPSYLVNAQYDPQFNDVTIPAAILQAPFYSLKQTDSENYGGIGATIGHEISHAFDNSGAQFDKDGNLDNWWTAQDYAKFQKMTKAMADEFNGIPYAGGTVNGSKTVGENIADNGGLNAALQAAKAEKDFNPEEFFETWAKSWRFKATPAYEKYLLAIDVHAPQPLRATVAVQNLDDFFTTYDVQAGDAMWLDPSQRVNIW